MNEDIKALEAILKEFLKLREKYEKKAKKERDKVNEHNVNSWKYAKLAESEETVWQRSELQKN